MSNNTSTGPDISTSTDPGTPTTSDPAPATTSSTTAPTTSSPAPPTTTSTPPPPPPTTTSSSSSPPPPTTTETSPTSNPPQQTSTSTPPPDAPSTTLIIKTLTESVPPDSTRASSSTTTASQSSGAAISPSEGEGGGLSDSGRIAVAVVVPIAAVALLVLAGIFLWRKRKQRKDAEEQRRKEVEDYGYNPNADPTIPAVAAGGFEMRDESSAGYRGWGSTTAAGSTGRKASTTMSGGAAYSDAHSPTQAAVFDSRSGEPLIGDVPPSPEGGILGVMGPSAANNRAGVHRGPSNASSSYSAANRSDGSGEGPIGVAYGGHEQYDPYSSGNPYTDAPYNGPPEGVGQPVIRDVTARRNTRIENPAHYPQQTAGISQNF